MCLSLDVFIYLFFEITTKKSHAIADHSLNTQIHANRKVDVAEVQSQRIRGDLPLLLTVIGHAQHVRVVARARELDSRPVDGVVERIRTTNENVSQANALRRRCQSAGQRIEQQTLLVVSKAAVAHHHRLNEATVTGQEMRAREKKCLNSNRHERRCPT